MPKLNETLVSKIKEFKSTVMNGLSQEPESTICQSIGNVAIFMEALVKQCENENGKINNMKYWKAGENQTNLNQIQENLSTLKRALSDPNLQLSQNEKNSVEEMSKLLKEIKGNQKEYLDFLPKGPIVAAAVKSKLTRYEKLLDESAEKTLEAGAGLSQA